MMTLDSTSGKLSTGSRVSAKMPRMANATKTRAVVTGWLTEVL